MPKESCQRIMFGQSVAIWLQKKEILSFTGAFYRSNISHYKGQYEK